MVAGCVRALLPVHDLSDDVLLLLEVLIDVLLSHLILVLARGLVGLERFLCGISRGTACLRARSCRILQCIT